MNKSAIDEPRHYIIIPREDGQWLLIREGPSDESLIFPSLTEAVREGEGRARSGGVRLKMRAGRKGNGRVR